MSFPFGTASLVILILALVAAICIPFSGRIAASPQASTSPARIIGKPDLVLATFTKEHAQTYDEVLPEFERRHNVKVQIQVVDQRALQGRLQSALQVGAEVPDMVELLDGTMGIFTRGPVEDVGFVDLTERVKNEGLRDKLVANRFGKWSTRGHLFALPHDVHPTMLAYRRDIVVDKLHIDVSKLTTWDEFARVGREITKDYNGDGIIDHYMIDLPEGEAWGVRALMLQRGGRMFDDNGETAFDSEATVDVFCWYVKQISGKTRIAFAAGWGQTLTKTLMDGLCLFYICPDWRTRQFEINTPSVGGKMCVMPMPAWESGGLRTSTWGGTGLAITKQCKNFELAWKLAMFLYYEPKALGERFASLNILPPYIPSWKEPQFDAPRAYWSGAKLGREFADLAQNVPNEESNAYMQMAEGKLWEAFTTTLIYYKAHGEDGLRDYARSELKRCADQVRIRVNRNVFLHPRHAETVRGAE
jgi:arabinosaccharide transport system substrate-binding protein